jgi:hypothetical protein
MLMSEIALAFGLGLLGLGVVLAWATGNVFPALMPGLAGTLVLTGTLFERYRYRKIETSIPGPDWVDTGERFVDPETNATVTVFYHPGRGVRRYVRGTAAGLIKTFGGDPPPVSWRAKARHPRFLALEQGTVMGGRPSPAMTRGKTEASHAKMRTAGGTAG